MIAAHRRVPFRDSYRAALDFALGKQRKAMTPVDEPVVQNRELLAEQAPLEKREEYSGEKEHRRHVAPSDVTAPELGQVMNAVREKESGYQVH